MRSELEKVYFLIFFFNLFISNIRHDTRQNPILTHNKLKGCPSTQNKIKKGTDGKMTKKQQGKWETKQVSQSVHLMKSVWVLWLKPFMKQLGLQILEHFTIQFNHIYIYDRITQFIAKSHLYFAEKDMIRCT